MNDLEQFKKLKTDKERWKFLLRFPEAGLIVRLDNDLTFVETLDAEDEKDTAEFDEYIGWSDGVQELLSAVGIKYECV